MSWSEIAATAAAIIAGLGGGGAIVLGLSNWIGRLLAERYVEKLKHEIQQEMESYKTKLKKSEFLFQKEFEAASQFVALRRRFYPQYRFPEMEWDDACEDFASNFKGVEKALESYLAEHGAALSKKTLDQISHAIAEAGAGKFEVRGDTVSVEGVKTADRVLEVLEKVEDELREAVRSQSTT
jgi:transcription antitermination factor NusG